LFSPLELLIALLVTAAAAALQGTVGVGFAMVSVPILTLLNSGFTPIPQVLMAFPMTIFMVIRERQHIDLRGAVWVLGGRLPGAIAGVILLGLLAQRTLDGMIAGIVLAAAVAMAAGWSVQQTRRNQFIAGVASGISGTTSAIGGPPLAFLYQHSSGERLRSSLAAIFSVGITINVTSLAVAGRIHRDDIVTAAILLPALAIGLYSSRWITGRIADATIRRGILIVSALAGTALAIRTIAGG
jgi:uncharacterized membrane protein YfcA